MVNEERTKRYSWGVEATTSLFLEGGLLVVCNRLPFVGSLYGRDRIRTEYARRRFASRYRLFRPAGSRTACGKGGTVPFVRHRGNVQSVERHAVFRFCQSRYGALFPAPECRPHLSRSEISIYVAVSLSLQALFA